MRIDRSSMLFNEVQIKQIEEKYDAHYICETCLKNVNGNWANQPFALFWTDVPHPEGSNYFAMYYGGNGNDLFITDGISATQDEFPGVVGSDGVVYYSRYRHDFRTIPGGFIDGGRDYIRLGGDVCKAEQVSLKIVGPNLHVIRNGEVVSELLQLEHQK